MNFESNRKKVQICINFKFRSWRGGSIPILLFPSEIMRTLCGLLTKPKNVKFECSNQPNHFESNRMYFQLMDFIKVEKILKGRLDSIPSLSPSVKIQIMGRKVCLKCKDKTFLGVVSKLLKTKSLLTSPSNVLPYYLK